MEGQPSENPLQTIDVAAHANLNAVQRLDTHARAMLIRNTMRIYIPLSLFPSKQGANKGKQVNVKLNPLKLEAKDLDPHFSTLSCGLTANDRNPLELFNYTNSRGGSLISHSTCATLI